MQFYSIFLATVALMVSTASAAEEHWQKAAVDCLNICREESTGYTCPPETEKASFLTAAGAAATLLKPGKDEE